MGKKQQQADEAFKRLNMKKTTIKSDMLKQPSICNLLLCALRKLLGKTNEGKEFRCPNFIGPYRLVSKIKKSNNCNNYGIGIYSGIGGKKVFIKTWEGRTKNFPYYSLINEYNMVTILNEKIKNTGNGKFRVPNPIGYSQNKNSLSVIFEYIDGKALSKFPIERQSGVINEAILFLDKLTLTLNKKDEKYIKKRGRLFYAISLPALFLYSFLLEKESKKTIFYSLLRAYFHSISILNKRFALIHGDLSPDNVLVDKSHFYILDSEHMKYTFAEYDLNYLSITKRNSKLLLYILRNRKDFARNTYLSLYIAMQFSIFADPKSKQRPFFDYLKN